jgi:hypothetical protein
MAKGRVTDEELIGKDFEGSVHARNYWVWDFVHHPVF